jgi:hypothetical protein
MNIITFITVTRSTVLTGLVRQHCKNFCKHDEAELGKTTHTVAAGRENLETKTVVSLVK